MSFCAGEKGCCGFDALLKKRDKMVWIGDESFENERNKIFLGSLGES